MTLRDLLVISGLCLLTEDADEAVRLALAEEVVRLFGEDAFERLEAIEASNEESEEVMLQILRSLAVDQEILDVKAGIPARDAEIAALRKEIETLRAQQPVSGADGLADYPTHGMSLGQRIAYVGGRENAQGYVEFGSPMAVHALIQHVLRDFHRQGRVSLAPAKQDADKVDAERWRAYRSSVAADDAGFLQRTLNAIEAMGLEDGQLPSEDQIDAAIDAARKEPGQ